MEEAAIAQAEQEFEQWLAQNPAMQAAAARRLQAAILAAANQPPAQAQPLAEELPAPAAPALPGQQVVQPAAEQAAVIPGVPVGGQPLAGQAAAIPAQVEAVPAPPVALAGVPPAGAILPAVPAAVVPAVAGALPAPLIILDGEGAGATGANDRSGAVLVATVTANTTTNQDIAQRRPSLTNTTHSVSGFIPKTWATEYSTAVRAGAEHMAMREALNCCVFGKTLDEIGLTMKDEFVQLVHHAYMVNALNSGKALDKNFNKALLDTKSYPIGAGYRKEEDKHKHISEVKTRQITLQGRINCIALLIDPDAKEWVNGQITQLVFAVRAAAYKHLPPEARDNFLTQFWTAMGDGQFHKNNKPAENPTSIGICSDLFYYAMLRTGKAPSNELELTKEAFVGFDSHLPAIASHFHTLMAKEQKDDELWYTTMHAQEKSALQARLKPLIPGKHLSDAYVNIVQMAQICESTGQALPVVLNQADKMTYKDLTDACTVMHGMTTAAIAEIMGKYKTRSDVDVTHKNYNSDVAAFTAIVLGTNSKPPTIAAIDASSTDATAGASSRNKFAGKKRTADQAAATSSAGGHAGGATNAVISNFPWYLRTPEMQPVRDYVQANTSGKTPLELTQLLVQIAQRYAGVPVTGRQPPGLSALALPSVLANRAAADKYLQRQATRQAGLASANKLARHDHHQAGVQHSQPHTMQPQYTHQAPARGGTTSRGGGAGQKGRGRGGGGGGHGNTGGYQGQAGYAAPVNYHGFNGAGGYGSGGYGYGGQTGSSAAGVHAIYGAHPVYPPYTDPLGLGQYPGQH